MEDPCWKKSDCYEGRGLTRWVPFEHDRVKIVECVTFKSLPYGFPPKISERGCPASWGKIGTLRGYVDRIRIVRGRARQWGEM